jgi:hypothetical protein
MNDGIVDTSRTVGAGHLLPLQMTFRFALLPVIRTILELEKI